MTALSIQPTFPIFTDIDGQPLEDGYVFIGTANLNPITNPITVYWDAALTLAAVQPIRTIGGYPVNNGTPARLYVNSDYSIQVQNRNGSVVYSAPAATERFSDVVVDAVIKSTDVTFLHAGTGAVTRTAQAKMRDVVSVLDFGADPTGATDSTTAIQAAINTGFAIEFPAGNYRCANLTQSTNFQRFSAFGQVTLTKNANGPIITCTGNYVEFNGIQFNGGTTSTPTFTGDNVVMTGSNPRLINCGSQWASGRALKATGSHVQVIGTCGIYQTADATGTGYDIEIGTSGTATLYHQLYGIYSGQPTGGILLTDTGSHAIVGGQFGKLTIASGTAPSGSNGGMTTNARILGDVTVSLSSSTFSGNQFSTQTITFSAGTSLHTLDASNNTSSATIVNNGNGNSTIVRATSSGGTYDFAYGPSSWTGSFKINTTNQWFFADNAILVNNKSLRFLDSTGTEQNGIILSSADDWTIGANSGANFMNIASGTVGIFAVVGGTTIAQFYASGLRPQTDNTLNLGTASQRWAVVFAGTGTINTSDAREKQDVADLDAAEKRVAIVLKGLVKKFRFKDAVTQKGDAARIHVGVIAQEVMAAFQAESLDPMRYAIVCYDEWDAEAEELDEDGNVVKPAREAGNRYGVRYEELLSFIIAAL